MQSDTALDLINISSSSEEGVVVEPLTLPETDSGLSPHILQACPLPLRGLQKPFRWKQDQVGA